MENLLDYGHVGRDFRIRNSGSGQIYTLCFASKDKRGSSLWNTVHKDDPSGQIVFPI